MRGRLFSRSSGISYKTGTFARRAQFDSVRWATRDFSQGFHQRSMAGKSSLPYGVMATMAGLAVGGYFISKLYEDDDINVELPTFREMRSYREGLKLSFRKDNQDNKQAHRTYDALLSAISTNNRLIAEEMLNDLIKMGAIVTEEMRDGLIVFTANHSKISILELLQEVFGEEEVLRNRHASYLLSLSPDEKERAAHFMEQCFQSPGEIKHDGMVMFIAVSQDELRDQMLQYRAYMPVYNTFDLAEDIAESYRHVLSMHEINQQLQTKFDRTLVVDLSENDTYQMIIEDFYKKLAKIAKDERDPVVGTMITTGAHFTISQIRVVQHESGSNSATVVFIDPKGSYSSMMTNDYGYFASIAPHVFDDVKVLISGEGNQLSGMGCSLFVGDQFITLMTLDELMESNTQYSFAGKRNVIFDYAEREQTSMHPYGVDFDADDDLGGTYAEVREFSLTRIPAVLTVGKQSLERCGELLDAPEEFILQENGRFSTMVREKERAVKIPGVMGLNRDMVESSPERQMEYNRPADLSCEKTVAEVIRLGIEPTEHKGRVKPRNLRIYHSAYRFGFFLSQNVERILKHDSAELRSQQDPDSVIKRSQ